MKDFNYAAPRELAQALSLLSRARGEVRPLVGGTDLLVQMRQGRRKPSSLVDVKNIPELNRLEMAADGFHIGAAVPLSHIIEHPQVKAGYPMLAQACSLIGSVQIRNRASLGGNLCNAAPSADTAPALLCLEARAVIAGQTGRRELPLGRFFSGPGQTALAKGELLVEVILPPPRPESRGCYLRLSVRQEMDIAIVGVACQLTMFDNVCEEAAIGLGAVAPIPLRVVAAERLLETKRVTPELIETASLRAAEAARPITDHRASAEYRRQMVQVLTRRALLEASRR